MKPKATPKPAKPPARRVPPAPPAAPAPAPAEDRAEPAKPRAPCPITAQVIEVQRVVNGFTIKPVPIALAREGCLVAETPERLTQILAEWAEDRILGQRPTSI
jgi:hypothetical protein